MKGYEWGQLWYHKWVTVRFTIFASFLLIKAWHCSRTVYRQHIKWTGKISIKNQRSDFINPLLWFHQRKVSHNSNFLPTSEFDCCGVNTHLLNAVSCTIHHGSLYKHFKSTHTYQVSLEKIPIESMSIKWITQLATPYISYFFIFWYNQSGSPWDKFKITKLSPGVALTSSGQNYNKSMHISRHFLLLASM